MNKPRIVAAHVFAVALMSGLMIAMVTQVVLAHHGMAMSGMWRNLFVANKAQVRSALAWWTTAGAALVGGFAVAFVASRLKWLYVRGLRGWLGAILVVALAVLARAIPADDPGIALGGRVGTSAAAMIVAAAMAGFGAFFALRR